MPHHLVLFLVNKNIRQVVREEVLEEWLDLDRILVRLWESLSIRVDVTWRVRSEGVLGDYFGCLLPEMTGRGMVTLNLTE